MNPAVIDEMSWAMAEVYGAVTDRILVNLAHYFPYIDASEEVSGSFEYQARMLAQMGQVNKDTVDIIMKSLDGADEALRQALETAITEALKTEEPKLREAAKKGLTDGAGAVPPAISPNQMQAFQAYYRQSADKLNLVNTVMLESTQAAYTATVSDVVNRIQRSQSILNVAAGEVVTGASAYNTAVRSAVRKMVDNGLTGFVDHGGHHWSPEAYVAMDVRTTMFNTARAATWEREDQYGIDTYQVSSHNGARPLCFPWQGKVISRSDRVRDVTDLDGNTVHVYAQSETSYGEAAGLFGVNCKHYPMTFIPGFSTLKGEPQDEEENAKTYEESQQQRALERKLREERRDLAVMKAQGASPEEIKAQQARVKKASQDIDDFCDETGRTRRKNREGTPVNAKFPAKESYDSAQFPTQTRDQMREFFGKKTEEKAPMYNSAEDFDREIEALRARRAELFDADEYDKAETDRLLREIQALQDQKADWVQAYTLSDGDLRLTNMLRSDDPTSIVGAVDEILDRPELGLPKSHWNGIARVRSEADMPKAAGYAYFFDDPNGGRNGGIDIRQDFLHEFSTAVHEDIHQRSRGDLSPDDLRYVLNYHRSTEEGAVQLMTEEVCKRLGYESRKTYPKQVDALRDFHQIIDPTSSDYAFAKRMLDRSPIARYNYIMDSIEEYRKKHPNMRKNTRDRLDIIESTFAKGASTE